jgi:hypothetical protein
VAKITSADHADMVANILTYWDSATPDQREAGARWYGQAGAIARMIGEDAGIDTHRVAMVISALSPRNPWHWNVFDAWSFCVARASGRTMPKATTFNRNKAAAWRALDPNIAEPWYTSAPKVKAFVAAILGDDTSVVVDTWAVRVATGDEVKYVGTDKAYWLVAHAYNVAANLRGVPPATMQATTWIVARTDGLATSNGARRVESFKSGTPDWLRVALSQ